ncbi:MAG: hypothetical protein A2X46_08385 [Lentisphaerae bacterium GWF2_57_35]|nr:MAG: hypothetical protein A2X46_08385 [Lentisphaerae bacterium GWF2_57_35]
MIELLVVIAIIAILASILIPSLSNSRERGRTVYCANNLNQLGKGLMMYLDANNDMFPPVTTDESVCLWDRAILPYIGEATNLFVCPSDPFLSTVASGEAPRSYSANGANAGVVPFGNYSGTRRLRMSDLDYHKGDMILLGEWPGIDSANRGLIGWFGCSALSLNDPRAGKAHDREQGGNYLLSSLSVRYIRKDEPTLQSTTGADNMWTLYTQ